MRDLKQREQIEESILLLRGQKVILDADLARLYGVPTHRFNEAFKRNRHRFPDDFAFQLTAGEFADLRSQYATSSLQGADKLGDMEDSSQFAMSSSQRPSHKDRANRSQFATSSSRHRGAAYRPWAFTEHGALMAANILRSERAVQMSVIVVRAFVRLREMLTTNKVLAAKLAELERKVASHDGHIQSLFQTIRQLMEPVPPKPRRISFHAKR